MRQIEYKAEWRDRTVVKVSRWYPSSQICFDCKAVNRDLKLSERDWRCRSCNLEHDRNANAARNLDFVRVANKRIECLYGEERRSGPKRRRDPDGRVCRK